MVRSEKMSLSRKYKGLGEKGFTLVELAVVLIILGALFMAVLKVESMVKNAKIRQVLNQYRELRSAILVYKSKYGYLPGDDPNAVLHVGSVRGGDGNGRIDYANGEFPLVCEHLGKAGLISGQYNGYGSAISGDAKFFPETPLLHAFSTSTMYDIVVVGYYAVDLKNLVQFMNLPYDAAQALDVALDDGVYNTGSVRSGKDYTAAATQTPFSGAGGHVYSVGSVGYTYIYIE